MNDDDLFNYLVATDELDEFLGYKGDDDSYDGDSEDDDEDEEEDDD